MSQPSKHMRPASSPDWFHLDFSFVAQAMQVNDQCDRTTLASLKSLDQSVVANIDTETVGKLLKHVSFHASIAKKKVSR